MWSKSEILIVVVIFGFLGLIIFLILKKLVKLNKQKTVLFNDFSLKHKLSHHYDKNKKLNVLHSLEGKYKGFPIKIFERMEGQRRGQHLATTFSFYDASFDFDFSISKSHIFNTIGDKLNPSNLKMVKLSFNDAGFDEDFCLKTNNEMKFRRLFDVPKIDTLKNIKPNLHYKIDSSKVELNYVVYENFYTSKAFKDLEKVLDFMILLLD